jgi:mono/diheme cytochrome c family protein
MFKSIFSRSSLGTDSGDERVKRSVFRLAILSGIALIAVAIALAQLSGGRLAFAQSERHSSSTESIARGKYLVESVAMCGTCHTPRESNGNFDRSRWLQGGPLPFVPAQPTSDWPLNAPRIGGTPPANDVDMIKLLTTGIWTTGDRLRFPMPQFRMERSDAEAVVAYLKSLTPQQ